MRARAAVESDAGGVTRPPLVAQPRDPGAPVPLSLAQQRMWFINQFDPAAPTYNLPFVVRLRGQVDIEALRAALTDVVQRQQSLRTIFPESSDGGYQLVLPMERVDFGTEVHRITADELPGVLAEFAARGFDVSQELPVRVRIFQVTGNNGHGAEYAVAFVVHHIAADGFSFGPLARDVTAAYLTRISGAAPSWEPLPVQYTDFSLWQRQVLGSEDDPDSLATREIAYWRDTLAGLPDQLDLPADRPRPQVQSFHGGRVRFEIDAELHARISELARAQGVSLFMVLHAALAVLLARLSGTADIAVGTPIAGRGEQALDNLIGMFVNTLVLRSEVDGAESFAEFLGRTRETDLSAFAHADVPFERLVEVLNPARSQARHPLFQVMLSFQELSHVDMEADGLSVTADELEVDIAKFDLQWTLTEKRGSAGELRGIEANAQFATDLFDADTIAGFNRRLLRVLETVTAEPEVVVGDIDLLDGDERELVTRTWISAGPDRARERTLVELFEAAATAHADRTAVVFDGERLTYRELDERANRLARTMVRAGVRPDALVAVALPRSADLVVALLATLKAGGAYLPVDPTYPAERIAFMLSDADPICVVTTANYELTLPAGVPVLTIETATADETDATPLADTDRRGALRPANLAYVIYTSGSTGRPKGVQIPHRNVVRLFDNTRDWFEFGPDDVWTMFHSYAFDFSVWELWGPLLHGGTLVVVDYYVSRSPEQFLELLREERVTVLNQTPSAFYQLAEADRAAMSRGGADGQAIEPLSLRYVVYGGEALELRRLSNWYARHDDDAPRLINMYGITETTVHVTYRALDEAAVATANGSWIGQAIPGLRVYLLDHRLRPVPVGCRGRDVHRR